jgi:hypothetical protein
VGRVSHEGPAGPEDLFHRAVKSEQCRAMSAYQSAQPLMSGVAVPLEHLVDRVEIRSDLLSLASAQVALCQHQETGLLERLKDLLVLLARLVKQPVDLSWGRQWPRLPNGFSVVLTRHHGNTCVNWRMAIVSCRFMSAESGGPIRFKAT